MTVPRRNRVDQWTPAERAIQLAVDAVEAAGADVRMTDAVILLGYARESVADFVDGVERRRIARVTDGLEVPASFSVIPTTVGREAREDAENIDGLVTICEDLRRRLVPFGASTEGWDSAIGTLNRLKKAEADTWESIAIRSPISSGTPPTTVGEEPKQRSSMRCPKKAHDNPNGGYLHDENDDGPYDVDGMLYCGRCHFGCDKAGRCEHLANRNNPEPRPESCWDCDGCGWCEGSPAYTCYTCKGTGVKP